MRGGGSNVTRASLELWSKAAPSPSLDVRSGTWHTIDVHQLTLGERTFLHALEELAEEKADLIKGARVSFKRNAAGDLVFAVIVPAVRLPPSTREDKKADRAKR